MSTRHKTHAMQLESAHKAINPFVDLMLKAEIVERMLHKFVVVEVAAILEVNVEETSRTKLKINTLYLWRSRKKLTQVH